MFLDFEIKERLFVAEQVLGIKAAIKYVCAKNNENNLINYFQNKNIQRQIKHDFLLKSGFNE